MKEINEQFSQIYDQYIDKIYRFVYLKVNSQEIAEDLTSKVFLKGFEAYNKSKSQIPSAKSQIKNPGAFLYQIARNAVVDYYREKGRTKIVSADNIPQIADPRPGQHDKAILNAEISRVKLSLQNIKKDYQDIIIWHYLEGVSVAEIAGIMEKPEGTVRVMLHRGLKALKNELIKEG